MNGISYRPNFFGEMKILWNEYFDKFFSISMNNDLTNLYELQSCVLDLLVRIPQVKVQKVKNLRFVDFTSTDLIMLQLVPSVLVNILVGSYYLLGLFFLIIIFY